jgi:hypothetical protein
VHEIERDWDTHFNGEVHWNTYATANLQADMIAAGFPDDNVVEHDLSALHGMANNRWYAISGRKPL